MTDLTLPIPAAFAEQIYRAVEHAYHQEDVEQKLSERFPDRTFSEEEIHHVLSLFERALDHSDGVMEEYWLCLDYAICESHIQQ